MNFIDVTTWKQGLLLAPDQFLWLMGGMGITAVIVFVCLYFVNAGYGKMISAKWGPAISNKTAWILMECPVFFVLLYFWALPISPPQLITNQVFLLPLNSVFLIQSLTILGILQA